jgi:hypothetical protein
VVDLSRSAIRASSLDITVDREETAGTTVADLVADAAPPPEDLVTETAARRSFWSLIDKHVETETERVLVFLRYELDLKSNDIQARRPDLFPAVADVYRTNRNLLDRLRRSRELQAWLGDEGLR